VAAGKPLLAAEHIEGLLPLPTAWATGEDIFCLRVRGESMLPTLSEGDYLLVRRQATVEHGAIAVASIEGEVTVKRVVLGGNGVTLKPDNDAFPALRVNRRLGRVEIIGKAIGVYRKL
jgi:repressor LexA